MTSAHDFWSCIKSGEMVNSDTARRRRIEVATVAATIVSGPTQSRRFRLTRSSLGWD